MKSNTAQTQVSTHKEATEISNYNITGMTCASCKTRIEKKLNKIPGVSAEVNLALGTAKVQAPKNITIAEIISTIEKSGYGAEEAHDGLEDFSSSEEGYSRASGNIKYRLLISAILSTPVMLISMISALQFNYWPIATMLLSLGVVTWGAWPFHKAMVKNAIKLSSSMNTLVSLGIIISYTYSVITLINYYQNPHNTQGEHLNIYFEVSAVITTFLLLGKYLETKANRKNASALSALLKLSVKEVRIIENGSEKLIPINSLKVNDIFIVKSGEKIASDGIVIEGNGAIDKSIITGESLPEEVKAGSQVISGTINTNGYLKVKTLKTSSDNTLAQIAKLLKETQNSKANISKLADKVSAIFVPIILALSLIVFTAWLVFTGDLDAAILAAVSVLVIACPCALGLATPTAILASSTTAAKLGILYANTNVIEKSNKITNVVFDKTGTLTKGNLSLEKITLKANSYNIDENKALQIAASIESNSEHPVAKAIVKAADIRKISIQEVNGFINSVGSGVKAKIKIDAKDSEIIIGTKSFLEKNNITSKALSKPENEEEADNPNTIVYLAMNEELIAEFTLKDQIKPDAKKTINNLKKLGIESNIFTGDNKYSANYVAKKIGVKPENTLSELKPEDKHNAIKNIQNSQKTVAMVGDGVNDAVAISTADIGIALGSGTDIAKAAADITIIGHEINKVAVAISLAKKSYGTIKANLFWAFFYNVAAIPLAAFGLLNPMIASLAMALSSVIVVFNSLLISRYKFK